MFFYALGDQVVAVGPEALDPRDFGIHDPSPGLVPAEAGQVFDDGLVVVHCYHDLHGRREVEATEVPVEPCAPA